MTKTDAKTIGYNHGYRTTRRQAGCDPTGFLSKPCNRFTMPPQKRSTRTAGTCTRTRQKRGAIDNEIIARWPHLWQRITIGALLALTVSGVLPMAVATFEIWLGDVYGLGATALCLVADAALIAWLVKRYA